MAADDGKKKVPLLFLAIAFGVVVTLTLVGSFRSQVVQKLAAPGSGVIRLCSAGGRLTAVSTDGKIRSWNWGELSNEPLEIQLNTDKVAAMDGGLVLSVFDGEYILVSDLSVADRTRRLAFESGQRCLLLRASPAGKYAAAAVSSSVPSGGIQFAFVEPGLMCVKGIDERVTASGLSLKDISISDAGALIAAVGAKAKGWIVAADTQTGRLLWHREVGESEGLTVVTFSPDGGTIYAAGLGRCVYALAADTGEVVRRFTMDEGEGSARNPQRVTCIVSSPDGRLIAAGCQPGSKVWLWDTRTGEPVASIKSGHRTISSIAFSPDGSMLTTADYEKRTPIKIWKVASLH